MTDKIKEQITFKNAVSSVFVLIVGWVGLTSHASAKSVAVLNSQMGVIIKTIEQTPTSREVKLMIRVAILEGEIKASDE